MMQTLWSPGPDVDVTIGYLLECVVAARAWEPEAAWVGYLSPRAEFELLHGELVAGREPWLWRGPGAPEGWIGQVAGVDWYRDGELRGRTVRLEVRRAAAGGDLGLDSGKVWV